MSTLLTPAAPQPRPQTTPRTARQATAEGPTPRRFLVGCARMLLVPLAAVVVLAAGWALVHASGWPAATAAMAGWSVTVVAWLRHRGWQAATAHLAAWAAPTALLVPLWALGSLSPAGLVVWGPVSGLLAIALIAAYDPLLV